MATIDYRKNRALGIVAALLIFAAAFFAAGCNTMAGSIPTAPSPAVSQAASTSSGPASNSEPPAINPDPGPGVAVDPPAPVENCGELDPQKWRGFSWSVEVDAVTMRNSSACDRVVTWRAFLVVSDSNQPPAGNAVTVVIPAGAGYGAPGSRMERPYVLPVHYSTDDGKAPCGVIQIDGRAGIVPNMTHANASFTPGRLFTVTGCYRRPTPPTTPPTTPVCTPGAWRFVGEVELFESSAKRDVCVPRRFRITETNGCTTRTRDESRGCDQ